MRQLSNIAPIAATDQAFIAELKNAVRMSLCDGHPSVREIATRFGLSVRTMQRRLREAGHTYTELVECVRNEEACRLLQNSTISIGRIAVKLGYTDASHFSRAFRRWAGTSPRSYRRSCRRGNQDHPSGPNK